MKPSDFQLKLPETERRRLSDRVLSDYRNAIPDHRARLTKWAGYMRRWQCTADVPALGDEDKSNYPLPLIEWSVFSKWAKEMDSLFGDDAEIVAVPVGPSDYKRVAKIGKYMTWRVFNSMKLTNPFCAFVLRKILFGRSVAYSPWKRDTFDVDGKEIVDYEGPDFRPLHPDDFIVPVEDAETLHDFSFVIRRYRATPDELLDGEEEGRYQGITDNFQNILVGAQSEQKREFEGEEIKQEQDLAESLDYYAPLSRGSALVVLEWYGRWRPLKGKKDAAEWDFKAREMRGREYVVRYIPSLNLVVGVQDLAQLYPLKKKKRPFVESSMIKDGSYWSRGMAQLLIDSEDELRVNHNIATDAGEFSVGPLLFYRPGSGFEPKKFRYEPKMAVPVDNPATDVRVEHLKVDLSFTEKKEQAILGYAERLTGLSDLSMGRAIDRPNAPKTARGTVALLEEGNVRLSLDTKVLAEDMGAVLAHFWEMEYMFAAPQTFFRVTEDDAGGLFPTKDGGSILDEGDRDGRYDFSLKFANSVYSREAEKERVLARYQLDLNNPLIVQNPKALWQVTNEVHRALGDPNFASLVPEPPAPDLPVDPKQEWALIEEGEPVTVNPMDNDELHLIRHMQDLQMAEKDPNKEVDAIRKLTIHYIQHLEQLQSKKVVQAGMEAMMQRQQAMMQQPGGPGGQPGSPLVTPPQPVAAPNPLTQGLPAFGPPPPNPQQGGGQ